MIQKLLQLEPNKKWSTSSSKISIKMQRFNCFYGAQETAVVVKSFILKLMVKVQQLPLLKQGKERSLVALHQYHG